MSTENKKKENILVNLCFNIIIPALILSKLSKPAYLGPLWGLVIALIFPLGYGIWDFYRSKKANFISILGFVSIFFTGIIGLFQFNTEWIAVKEATVPLVIGIMILISTRTKSPLVKTFIYNDQFLDIEHIEGILNERGNLAELNKMLVKASVFLALSFFFSAILNFVLAKVLVTSPAGTESFNQELSRMMVLSYPVIALPCTIIMVVVLFYVIRSLRKLTGLGDEIYSKELRDKAESSK